MSLGWIQSHLFQSWALRHFFGPVGNNCWKTIWVDFEQLLRAVFLSFLGHFFLIL